MFKKFAAEALGISDIGVIVPTAEYDKVDADDYLFHEDGERIFFLIKSKKDEYCFSNLALVHVDGESAVSSKRTVKRYEYTTSRIANVRIETAGTLDMDVELKFRIGSVDFSIDVKKSFIEQVKDCYKALIAISRQQSRDSRGRRHAMQVLNATGQMFKVSNINGEQALVSHYNALLHYVNHAVFEQHTTRDFSRFFERYIQGAGPVQGQAKA